MKTIVLGLHGGATAEGAVRLARLLSERMGAPVEAIAALEPLPVLDYGYGQVYIPDPAVEDTLEAQLRSEAEKQLARCGLGGAKLSVMRGPRAASIANAAAARDAGLIVVGIGPHHVTDRALGGETALHLAQQASTPLLAVPSGVGDLPHRVLVAVDFSPPSLAAARLAASLLTAGDTLELAHVAPAAEIDAVVLGPAHAQQASRRLEECAAQLGLPVGVHLLTRVFGGDPTRTLLDVAHETHADMIALGSHGYSLWQRVLIGSVSSKVLRVASCAVLIYPARCVAPAGTTEQLETTAASA
jgi:nucleotide-binding universal stress UspA family protein